MFILSPRFLHQDDIILFFFFRSVVIGIEFGIIWIALPSSMSELATFLLKSLTFCLNPVCYGPSIIRLYWKLYWSRVYVLHRLWWSSISKLRESCVSVSFSHNTNQQRLWMWLHLVYTSHNMNTDIQKEDIFFKLSRRGESLLQDMWACPLTTNLRMISWNTL
jgi:hypothetical protein